MCAAVRHYSPSHTTGRGFICVATNKKKKKKRTPPPNLILYYITVLRRSSVMVGILVEAYYRKDSIDRQRVFLEINFLFNS